MFHPNQFFRNDSGDFISRQQMIAVQRHDRGEILILLLYLSIIMEISNFFFFSLDIFFLYLNPAYDSVTLCA